MKSLSISFLVLIVIIVNVIILTRGYILDPPSGKIEIIESESYILGFEESDAFKITTCAYFSDTGIKGSFEIIAQNKLKLIETELTSNAVKAAPPIPNSILNFGEKGQCKIQVRNVNDAGPKIWNMMAYLNKILISNATFSVTFFYRAAIWDTNIGVLEGSGIFNHLVFDKKNIVSCRLKMSHREVELNMKSAEQVRTDLTTEDTLKRISSLGRNLCGFKLIQISKKIDGYYTWYLSATDDLNKLYRASFYLNIEQAGNEANRHRTQTIYFNEKFEIDCGCRFANMPTIPFVCNSSAMQQFCEMYKPDGTLVETKNDKYVAERTTMEHVGLWRYYVGHVHSMNLLDFTVDVKANAGRTVEVWQNETTTHLNLGCRLANYNGQSVQYCALIAPNNQIINLRDFSATDRYLAIGTDLRTGVCSLQIKKPLKDFEMGLWRCQMSPKAYQLTGGYLKVHSLSDPDYPKLIKHTTNLKERFEINCRVPYFSEYCYVKSPNGTVYQTTLKRDIRLGKCSYTINDVQRSDNGTWRCFYASTTGNPDDEIKVEVLVAEVLHYYKHIEADSGDNVEIKCSSGGTPMKYCRFISPTGEGYQIKENEKNERITYHGTGLENGECGIKISNIQSRESGTWECVTELYGSEDEVVGNINIEVLSSYGPSMAAIGIGSSIMVVLIVIVGIVYGIHKLKNNSSNLNISRHNNNLDENDIELFTLQREE